MADFLSPTKNMKQEGKRFSSIFTLGFHIRFSH